MTMNSDKSLVFEIARTWLKKHCPLPPYSKEILRRAIQESIQCLGASNMDEDKLVAELKGLYTISIDKETILDDHDPKNHIPWLPNEKSTIEWGFWERYSRYLEEEKHWSPTVLNRLDDLTDEILGRLENPKRAGSWDRRGMVVGQVQSGKTSNYIGLICKAVDAGYKVIVVLAGVHKSLRSQTQLRLDEGFLGRDSQNQRAYEEGIPQIGAGKIPTTKKLIVHSFTSSADQGDFNRKVANQLGVVHAGDPILLVVKKNKSVLENLVRWARSTTGGHSGKKVIRDIPLLVIDDEADHSSINTKLTLDETGREADENKTTTINQLIRRLLKSFDQSAYVGYTATPFANIFIYPQSQSDQYGDDLFPRNFIVNLPAPTNYVGPAQLFGMEADKEVALEEVEGLDIIREANDQEEWMPVGHKKEHQPPYLPASLKDAIRAFILTCGARIARGQDGVHNSMLIHVTRYTDVQHEVNKLVKDELKHIEKQLRDGKGNPPLTVLCEFEKLWKEDFVPTTESVKNQHLPNQVFEPVTWDKVRDQLYPAASRIQVK